MQGKNVNGKNKTKNLTTYFVFYKNLVTGVQTGGARDFKRQTSS